MISRPMSLFPGLIGICLILLGGGMGCATENVDQPRQVMVTDENANESIQLQQGQQLIVRLPANPSTGYSWSQVETGGSVLKMDGPSAFEQDQSSDNPAIVGAGGTEVFTFVAEAAGQQSLQMEYKRPWETGVPPAKSVSYSITVD